MEELSDGVSELNWSPRSDSSFFLSTDELYTSWLGYTLPVDCGLVKTCAALLREQDLTPVLSMPL